MFLPFTNTTLATVAIRAVGPTGNFSYVPARTGAPYPYPNGSAPVSGTAYSSGTIYPRGTSTPDGLTISTNGQCSGGQTRMNSKFGDSCSQWGYCGSYYDPTYSGPGCQPEFGVCSSSNSSTGGNSSSSALPSTLASATIFSSTSTAASSTEASSSAASSLATSSAVSSSAPAPKYSFSPTTTSSAAPTSGSTGSSASVSASNQYTQFTGTGSESDGWPAQSKWKDFDTLFEMNRQIMRDSCAQWNVPNDSDSEIDDIKSAISEVSKSSGVDGRFILVIMLQESNGCVRAPVTSLSVQNPGLLQSYMGSAKCNSGSATAPEDVQSPCPASTIHDMINQGTTGTVPGGMSLTYALQKSAARDVSKYYKAARIYNSGSIASSGLLQDGVATHCYASDIANRLLGWSLGPSKCTLDTA